MLSATLLLALIVPSQTRACASGVSVVAVDAGPTPSLVSNHQVMSMVELEAMNRGQKILTPAELAASSARPELLITQHLVYRAKTDDLYFTIRAELRELGSDASGARVPVIVWQSPPLSGLTSGDDVWVLIDNIVHAARIALRECGPPKSVLPH